ncbi:glycine-rich protein 1-like [Drosophila teissieri]|uniref:glycine-rich protein 1-like n=1 Tax=Drosophila teissieri TaxID=7243 RepID=UPI001CBA01AB|nr:glycine-rich protein 1-like [Drosophila teissieri]
MAARATRNNRKLLASPLVSWGSPVQGDPEEVPDMDLSVEETVAEGPTPYESLSSERRRRPDREGQDGVPQRAAGDTGPGANPPGRRDAVAGPGGVARVRGRAERHAATVRADGGGAEGSRRQGRVAGTPSRVAGGGGGAVGTTPTAAVAAAAIAAATDTTAVVAAEPTTDAAATGAAAADAAVAGATTTTVAAATDAGAVATAAVAVAAAGAAAATTTTTHADTAASTADAAAIAHTDNSPGTWTGARRADAALDRHGRPPVAPADGDVEVVRPSGGHAGGPREEVVAVGWRPVEQRARDLRVRVRTEDESPAENSEKGPWVWPAPPPPKLAWQESCPEARQPPQEEVAE